MVCVCTYMRISEDNLHIIPQVPFTFCLQEGLIGLAVTT